MKNWKVLLLFISLSAKVALCQQLQRLPELEDSLAGISEMMWVCRNDSARLALNARFQDLFITALGTQGSFEYPFDSLKGISRLRSDDGLLRVISWNLAQNNQTFQYFGYVQVKDKGVFPLVMNRLPGGWTERIVDNMHWYGALYYRLITESYHRKKYYTLLGWDGKDQYSDSKLIDLITLDKKGMPSFGGAIFKTPAGIKNRVVIDYAERGNLTLRYDNQALWVDRGRKIREKKARMIITDRLISLSSSDGNGGKNKVPVGDTYDAYLFTGGYWTFIEEVSAKNHK